MKRERKSPKKKLPLPGQRRRRIVIDDGLPDVLGGTAPIDLSTPKALRTIEKLARYLNEEQIGDYLGIHQRTLRKKMAEDPKVRAAYKRGKARAVRDVGQTLVGTARDGNVTAMIFYLKTQGRYRETTHPEDEQTDDERVRQIHEALNEMDKLTAERAS